MLHEEIWNSLTQAMETDKVFHALVFEGPEGVGKKTLARSFAMALHCEAKDKPCGTCPSCIKHKTGNHPDYREVYPEKGKKNIAVNMVRSAFEDLYIRPLISDKKIIFIPEADLCEAASQNAMLKSFEEPPPYGVILLAVKNLSALLPTIRSRAVIYSLNPVPRKEIRSFIEENYGDMASSAEFMADFSGGIIGKAVSLLENEEFSRLRRDCFALLERFHESRYQALKTADFFIDNEANEALLYEMALSFFRDMAALKQGADSLINSDFSHILRKCADNVSKKGASEALFLLAEAKTDKSKNAIYSLWITDLMIALWEVLHG